MGDIYFSGVNEHKSSFIKEVNHEGTKTYAICAMDYALTSYVLVSSIDGQEVEVSYSWALLSDNKTIKTEKENLGKGTVLTTKVYSTTTSDF